MEEEEEDDEEADEDEEAEDDDRELEFGELCLFSLELVDSAGESSGEGVVVTTTSSSEPCTKTCWMLSLGSLWQ